MKKIVVGYCNGQPWLCLAAVRSVSVGHTVKCVFVYIRCMRATIVYIYLCDCTAISECEAHLIIVPASVCVCVRGGYKVMEGVTCFRSQEGRHGRFLGRGRDRWRPWRRFRVRGQCAVSLRARALMGSWGRLLFDDLRTVAPGLGLSLGQGQPGRLCGHLRRVAGGEAL